jgi:putative hydrolase of the HAD superfamily
LFDLGGVVIEIDLERMLERWLPHSTLTLAELRSRLRIDEPYRRHERGEITAPDYMRHLGGMFEIEADVATIAEGWNAMLVQPIGPALDSIRRVQRHMPCFAFSNTSAVHRDAWLARFPEIEGLFDRLFLSFELGLRKPEPTAFEAVVTAIGKPPGSILFFDDSEENIEGARLVGMQAVLVQGPQDIQAALAGRGLLQADALAVPGRGLERSR